MAMAMKTKSGGQELVLAKRAVEIMKELGEQGQDEDQKEFMEMSAEAEKAISMKPPPEALQSAIEALEQMLLASVRPDIVGSVTAEGEPAGKGVIVSGKKAHLIKPRIREILWIIKDAVGCFKESGDHFGKGLAQKALARLHLARCYELDAPMAALRCAKDAVATFHALGDLQHEAQALCLASAAHRTKAGLSPYEKVTQDENVACTSTLRQAISLFKKAGDKKGEGRALHSMAVALLSSDDEDQQLDAERYVEDALQIFKELKNRELECIATMSSISARLATSGPEAAIGLAKDAALDWKKEGGRPKDEGMAMHAAAEIHLGLGELDDCTDLCQEAMRMFERGSSAVGKAGVSQTLLQVAHSKGNQEKILKASETVAIACEDAGDKRGAGSALAQVADLLLKKLISEVGQDTEAASKKEDPPVGLSTEEVGKRTEDALEYANRAFILFEEIQDEPGMAEVQNVIQGVFQKGVDIYCAATEPDRIYTTLELDGPKEKESVLEWSIDFPHAKRLIMKG